MLTKCQVKLNGSKNQTKTNAYASKKETCRGEEELTGGREKRKSRGRVVRMH